MTVEQVRTFAAALEPFHDGDVFLSERELETVDRTDLAGIASWSVDNAEFSVDSEGRVRNLVTLAPGVHAVTVSVSDANDNVLQGQFIVTVGNRPATTQPTTTQPTTTPSGGGLIDSAILFGAGVGATLVIVAVVCVMGRRKPSSK